MRILRISVGLRERGRKENFTALYRFGCFTAYLYKAVLNSVLKWQFYESESKPLACSFKGAFPVIFFNVAFKIICLFDIIFMLMGIWINMALFIALNSQVTLMFEVPKSVQIISVL
uniref:Uncharacterized protein n=1 Tax=Micrurus lemniscatus lemniscatus TaxID=129467 RepID=A0A2D4I5A9_MICLE